VSLRELDRAEVGDGGVLKCKGRNSSVVSAEESRLGQKRSKSSKENMSKKKKEEALVVCSVSQ
jgi:hypothetical protein